MIPSPLRILVADDEPDLLSTIGQVLEEAGHRVSLVGDGCQALAATRAEAFDLLISDVRLPGVDGMTLFRSVREKTPETDVILMSAHANVSDAVKGLKEGLTDYLAKPCSINELLSHVDRIALRRTMKRDLVQALAEVAAVPGGTTIICRSPQMTVLLDRMKALADSEAPMLITGESGTGKELVSLALHRASARRDKPFVAVNCAAFPQTLIDAELFGFERGAFTGANMSRAGRFKAANHGTLLLDEVAEIPLPVQAKLLRVLQEGTVEPLGSNESIRLDVRVISATHRNLKELVHDGLFREDLYYRIKVLDLDIPPLRERTGDRALLIAYFLRRFTPAGRAVPGITVGAWDALARYSFPGNVRELEHAIEHAVVMATGGDLDVRHLPSSLWGEDPAPPGRGLRDATRIFERDYLMRILADCDGRKSMAAELLGISRKNLWEKLRNHAVVGYREDEAQ